MSNKYTIPGIYMDNATNVYRKFIPATPPDDDDDPEGTLDWTVEWEHTGDGDETYGGSHARAVIKTDDFIIACGSDNGKAVIRALNINTGEVEVEYTYTAGLAYGVFGWVCETSDGGFAACGVTNETHVGFDRGHDASGDGLVMRLPAPEIGVEWVPTWVHIYDEGGEDTSLARIVEAAPGEFAICGQRGSVEYGKRHSFVFRLSDTDDGETPVWDNVYQANEEVADYYTSWFAALVATDNTANAGFVCCGTAYKEDYSNPPAFQDPVIITSSGLVATVTHVDHGIDPETDRQKVRIEGATQPEYNGHYEVTYVDEDTYTYSLVSSTTSPALGSPLASPYTLYGAITLAWIDKDGNETHHGAYEDPDGDGIYKNFEGRAISNIKDGYVLAGGFVTEGTFHDTGGLRDAFIWKVPVVYDGTFGDFSSYGYPGIPNGQDHCQDIRQLDNRNIFCGYAQTSFANRKDIWVVELNGTSLVNHKAFNYNLDDFGFCVIPEDEANVGAGLYVAGSAADTFYIMFVT